MRASRKTLAALGLALLVPFAAVEAQTAPTPTPPPPACQAAEHRQFDFWLGEWEVFLPNGNKAGDSRIESIAGGCALLENWTGGRGFSGKSVNIYDRADQRWHQSWVDSSGARLELAGVFADKRMVLSSAPRAGAIQRIAWSPNDDGSVRQLWESSADEGKTWTVQFDGRYVRRR